HLIFNYGAKVAAECFLFVIHVLRCSYYYHESYFPNKISIRLPFILICYITHFNKIKLVELNIQHKVNFSEATANARLAVIFGQVGATGLSTQGKNVRALVLKGDKRKVKFK
ncbi:MAG: hypothetical protein LBB90_12160, partial [Tannerella sp.]|nr:hypothetical protein [Tannerella sp.]